MKTFFRCLLLCGATFVLLACDSFGSKAGGTAFNVQYTRYTQKEPVTTTVISSKNELEEYYGNQKIKISEKQGDVWYELKDYNTIEKYSDDFFVDSFLVIVELSEPSTSVRHRVESIDRNGNIVISRLLPEMGTLDTEYWGIIIELNNNLKADQFQAVLVDVDDCK